MTIYKKSLITSLLLHVGALLFFSVQINTDLVLINKEDPKIEIEVLDRPPKELKKLKKYNNQEDKDATILSEQNNKGNSKKIDITGGKTSQSDRAKDLDNTNKDSNFNSLTDGDGEEDQNLSSKQLQFFSFFKRLKEQLRQEWAPLVKDYVIKEEDYIELRRKTDRTIIPLDKRKYVKVISKVYVSLTSDGNIKDLFIVTKSGNNRLDEIALISWKKASPFMNVPKELLKDGIVELEWRFIVLIRI